MFALFQRITRAPQFDASGLGSTSIARLIAAGCTLPAGTTGVVVGAGSTRRLAPGARIECSEREAAWCFHPGPYTCDLLPFAAAPEIGLRAQLVVDSADPRLHQQRFDLFLASEAQGELTLAQLKARIDAALQRELAQGHLALPPCTTLDEWNAFRGGFNQLLYARFGLSVDDCVPVDLGASADYARQLRQRAQAAPALAVTADVPPAPPSVPPSASPSAPSSGPNDAHDPGAVDACVLRRLFLELPALSCALRQAALPDCPAVFHQQQGLLRRLDLACLAASTMPALTLAGPGLALAPGLVQRRVRESARAALALDDAWALLARLQRARCDGQASLFTDFDGIVASLEAALAARRTAADGAVAQ